MLVPVSNSLEDTRPTFRYQSGPNGFACLVQVGMAMTLLLIGLVVGLGVGLNLARVYPDLSLPAFQQTGPLAPAFAPAISEPNPLVTIQILEVKRTGTRVDVAFEIINDGARPFEATSADFFLLDSQSRRYAASPVFDLPSMTGPINPGYPARAG